jgi:hypothetical protein
LSPGKAFNPKALPAVSPHLHLGLINNCVLMSVGSFGIIDTAFPNPL